MKSHPLSEFRYCPRCGTDGFGIRNPKAKECTVCSFVYYFNPSAAVACFVKDREGLLLVCRRKNQPAAGTLDLPGGFCDSYETAEQTVVREIKEETGLCIDTPRYLFSLPNIYEYSGFEVHTVDMFFEVVVPTFDSVKAADDVSEIIIMDRADLDSSDFGLPSVSKAIDIYKAIYYEHTL